MVTAIAFEAAYQTRRLLPFLEHDFYLQRPVKALLLGASVVAWVVLGYWLDVYDKLDSAHPRVILRDTFRQCAVGFVAVLVLEYFLRLDLSRAFLLLFGAYSWIFLCLFRWKAGSLVGVVRREFASPHYVMVVGLGDRARKLGEALEQSAKYGIRLVGFLSDEAAPPVQLSKAYDVHPLSSLNELLRRQVIDEIIFAVDSHRLADLEECFLLCDEEGVRTRVVVDFFPHVNSQIYLDRLGSKPMLTFSAAPHDEVRLLLKRATDVVLAAASLVLLWPFMLLIAGIIRLTSSGPAIFRQERCGLNGRRFTFYKFRSMCDNAEDLKSGLQHLSRRSTAFKIPNDPRLTPVGRKMLRLPIHPRYSRMLIEAVQHACVPAAALCAAALLAGMGWREGRLVSTSHKEKKWTTHD